MVAIEEQTLPLSNWLTTAQVSHRLEYTPTHVRRLAAAGLFRTIPTPHGLLFDPVSVEEVRRSRAAGSRDDKEPA